MGDPLRLLIFAATSLAPKTPARKPAIATIASDGTTILRKTHHAALAAKIAVSASIVGMIEELRGVHIY